MPDETLADWGRFEFRFLQRKRHYTLTQRGAFISLWCAAGLDQSGGRLKRATAIAEVGKRNVDFLIEQGDLLPVDDGDVTPSQASPEPDQRDLVFAGWEIYQEPLERIRANRALSGAERTRLWRERRARESSGDGDVTSRDDGDVTRDARDARSSLSSSSSSLSGATDDEKNDSAREPDVFVLAKVVENLTGRPWQYSPGSKTLETLRYDVRDFGRQKVEHALRSVAGANGKVPDAAALILGAHRLLVPIPDPKKAREEEAAERERRDFDRRVEATRARNRALTGGAS